MQGILEVFEMKKFLILSVILIGFVVPGCNKPAATGVPGKPQVVVSIPPYISIVKAIAGDTVNVQSVVPANFDPHTMEATPSQREMIHNADLFICIGELFEDKLIQTLHQENKGFRILQLNEKIPVLSYSETSNLVDACADTHIHLEAAQDVHFWLSPKRLPLQATVIADALTDLKPELGKTYSQNADAFIQKVQKLDDKIQQMLQGYQRKALLVPHSALGYFCFDYNLVQIAIECEGKSPLPHDMTRVVDLAKHSNVVCAFNFPQFNNKGVELITAQLQVPTYSLDPEGEDILGTLEQLATDICR